MGGCCGCFKDTSAPQNPARVSEVHVPQSFRQGSPPAVSGGLLNDTSRRTLDFFLSDLPLGVTQEICADQTNTSLQTIDSTSTKKTVDGDNYETGTSSKSEKLKESVCKTQTALKLGSAKGSELELAKLGKAVILDEEESACPIYLGEYDAENPKIFTQCDHHVHIECIHDWMKRNSLCPVCNKDVAFNSPSH
ncbi:hypothetical protein AAZX31_01G206000 [Glycine max]|uniref:RING-type E3 ubiquitin transferase n=1 Tax=Glycine max TaxID=3847 RepID=A0A0R0LF94_SOYBN|nr:hypothetical protein GLYMA_01G221000v4 [Glycine max]|eukprot:XP_025979600.1 probable E3 ubiquitin-protein ligase RHB1A [Glycine max]